MLKTTLSLVAFVLSLCAFSQDKSIKGNPLFIDESMQRAIVKMNKIVGHNLDYHTKSEYKNNNLIKKESFNKNGDLIASETISYNDKNDIISREIELGDGRSIIAYKYEYYADGYVVTKFENDMPVTKTTYTLDSSKHIIMENEINLLSNTSLFIEKTYKYEDNFLVQNNVKYNNGNYTIKYKNDNLGNPIEELYLDKDKNIFTKILREYDSNNNLVGETIFDKDGKIKSVSKILYEYDSHKNWTKRTQYVSKLESPVSNTLRTIKYI